MLVLKNLDFGSLVCCTNEIHKVLFQVLGGCISGPERLVASVRTLHNIMGGVLNPVSLPVTWTFFVQTIILNL